MPEYNFDKIIERRSTTSAKWTYYEEDVLPLWVADMDFESPPAVIEALHRRVDHGVFGYTRASAKLNEVICERMKRLYDWDVQPEELVHIPGLVQGLHLVNHTFGNPGDGVLLNTPVYGPFFTVTTGNGKFGQYVFMDYVNDGDNTFHYEIDFQKFEDAITSQTTMFLLCNPHNPGGRVFTRHELECFAEICERHDLLICADEVHSDMRYDGFEHIPIATLSPEISQRTITLIAPSKTFNLAGLGSSVAIIQNESMREKLTETMWHQGAHVNILGYTASLAAYQHGDEWLQALMRYLQGNRDFLVTFIREEIPAIKTTVPEATFLAWLDCRGLPIEGNMQEFFLNEARVAFNPADFFGLSDAFVRLNFGCPRPILQEALTRMKKAIDSL